MFSATAMWRSAACAACAGQEVECKETITHQHQKMFKNKRISFLVSFVPEAASLVCFIHDIDIEVISPFFLGWDTDPSEKGCKSDKHKSKAQAE